MDTGNLGRGAMIAGSQRRAPLHLHVLRVVRGPGRGRRGGRAGPAGRRGAGRGRSEPSRRPTPRSTRGSRSTSSDLILLLAVLVSVGLAAMTLIGSSASLPVAGSAAHLRHRRPGVPVRPLPDDRPAGRGRRARDRALARPARDGGHRRGRLSRHAGGGNLLLRTGGPAQELVPEASAPGRPLTRAARRRTAVNRVLIPRMRGRVASRLIRRVRRPRRALVRRRHVAGPDRGRWSRPSRWSSRSSSPGAVIGGDIPDIALPEGAPAVPGAAEAARGGRGRRRARPAGRARTPSTSTSRSWPAWCWQRRDDLDRQPRGPSVRPRGRDLPAGRDRRRS